MIGSTKFTLGDRFSDLKAIGKGSYGVVVSADDASRGRRVAIKRISPMAKHTIDAKHILREVRIMRYMGRHENIITLEDLIVREKDDELYIVMELLDSDLHRVLQSKQSLSENHFKHFMLQILCGLKFLHDNRIIHRDLKPGNLLVTRDCRLRITDFGLARERPIGNNQNHPDDNIAEPMTEHVVTRWYRPPELMLCPDGMYTYAVDLWSVGCILAEMLSRKPLFPGKNFVNQLTLIFDVIGSPLPSEVSHIRNSQARKFLDSQVSKRAVPLDALFPDASAEALALLESLLPFAPEKRLTVDAALHSSFLEDAFDEDSPSLVFPSHDKRCEFEFERNGSTKFMLKDLIMEEARSLTAERPDNDLKNVSTSIAGSNLRQGRPLRATTASSTAEKILPRAARKPPGLHAESDATLAKARAWLSAAAAAASDCAGEIDSKPLLPPNASADASSSIGAGVSTKTEKAMDRLDRASHLATSNLRSPGRTRRERAVSVATKRVSNTYNCATTNVISRSRPTSSSSSGSKVVLVPGHQGKKVLTVARSPSFMSRDRTRKNASIAREETDVQSSKVRTRSGGKVKL